MKVSIETNNEFYRNNKEIIIPKFQISLNSNYNFNHCTVQVYYTLFESILIIKQVQVKMSKRKSGITILVRSRIMTCFVWPKSSRDE